MEYNVMCKSHQTNAELVCRDDENKLIPLCTQCLLLQSEVLNIKIVLDNLNDHKKQMIAQLNISKETNINTLRELINCLSQFKKIQLEKIDRIINYGEQEINEIEKRFNGNKKQIEEFNASIDVENLIELFNKLESENFLDNTKIKLDEMLVQVFQTQSVFSDSYKILQRFPCFKNLTKNENYQKLLKKAYKCPIHKETIVGVVLTPDESMTCDVICVQCMKTKTTYQATNFTELDEAEKIWKDYHTNSQYFYECLKNTVLKLVTEIKKPTFDKLIALEKKKEKFLGLVEKYQNQKLILFQKLIQQHNFSEIDFSSQSHLGNLKQAKLVNETQKFFENKIKRFDYQIEQKRNQISYNFWRLRQFQNLVSNRQIDQIKHELFSIKYQQKSVIKQTAMCGAIAINGENKTLVAGCQEQIKVFEFNLGILNFLTTLHSHTDRVFCLQFIKNQNNFISAGKDGTIKIWIKEQKNWEAKTSLQAHTGFIYSLVINSNGDQIISGSKDKLIKFWNKKENSWNNSQIISEHKKDVQGLSLSESETKLISCGQDKQILVMELITDKQWSIIQKINVEFGSRLCFITDNLFSYQTNSAEMLIYKFDFQQKLFYKVNSIEMKENQEFDSDNFLFPQKYIKQKKILVNKYKNYLNVIRIDGDEKFMVDQCIELKSKQHYGTISDDGEFLVIWDDGSKQISVREYDEVAI